MGSFPYSAPLIAFLELLRQKLRRSIAKPLLRAVGELKMELCRL